MGCELGKCRSRRNSSRDESHLTQQDLVRLGQIWDMIDSERVCLAAIVAVLRTRPILLKYFGLSPTETEDLSANVRLIAHAKMIASFLTTIVRNLDLESGNADRLLSYVGAVHFQKGINFTAENYLVFKRKFAASMSEQVTRAQQQIGDGRSPFRKLTTSSVRSKMSTATSDLHRFHGDDLVIEKFLSLVVKKLREGFLSEAVRERPKKQSLGSVH